VLVETGGVGQSETVVSDMVDFFLVLMLSGAGDELQGIKKGVLEMADAVAVNKADGDNVVAAEAAAATYRQALHLMTPPSATWTPPVLTCSALHDRDLDAIWEQIVLHRSKLEAAGELVRKRQAQDVRWMWSMVADRLMERFRADRRVRARLAALEAAVRAGSAAPTQAADELLALFTETPRP
jgi:LAO/AO transport system kinase